MAQADSYAHRRAQVVVVGLGGIGGGIARRMAEQGRYNVIGMDVDGVRASEWQEQTGSRGASSFDGIDGGDVRCMFIAVRTVQQIEVVLSD